LGGQYYIGADLAAMPLANMALLIAGIMLLVIIAAVVCFVFITRLGIKNIGPLKFSANGMSTEYHMNKRNQRIDDECRQNMQRNTGIIKRRIGNALAEYGSCNQTNVGLTALIATPLHDCIANNHFTTELLPENYGEYRRRVLELVKDEYSSITRAHRGEGCTHQCLPAWDGGIRERLTECVNAWLVDVAREQLKACRKKLRNYAEFLVEFEANKDAHRAGFTKKCIEKNERNIAVIEALIRSGGN